MKDRFLGFFRFVRGLFRGYLQRVLLIAFFLVAFIPVLFGSLAISRVIQNYLAQAQAERVDRDMRLAQAFYDDALRLTAAISYSMGLDNELPGYLARVDTDAAFVSNEIDKMIQHRIVSNELQGSQFIGVFTADGDLVTGRVLFDYGVHRPVVREMNWRDLPILDHAARYGALTFATEVIPDTYLEPIGLAEQARIPLIDTPRADPVLFDPREGRAALALTAVSPVYYDDNRLAGFVVVLHNFNRDFTLVDRIKETAGVDTATIFLGDQRVSTNVRTETGERAIGTRISKEVAETVLFRGEEYTGRAFVVNENFITRYSPLRDHANHIVGVLYVGIREANFISLVYDFYRRVVVIALVSILIAVVLALPVARSITSPIRGLVRASARVARGDLSARVEEKGRGELRQLSESFNAMVAELQDTQDELVQAKNLASIGQLAAGVAHEINNPLGTIMLYSDVLLRETPPTPQYQDDLGTIRREAARCKEIVTALLDFARQNRLMAQDTDVNIVLDELLHDIEPMPLFENVVIHRDFEPDLPEIQADPGQLRQVFTNLLNNAAEAMPEGGAILVSTRTGPERQRISVTVADSGVGIAPDLLPKLFTPFFTTKPIGRGTGLGLAITYGIVKMHRGQIQVQSEVGKGSRFTVTLPVSIGEAAQAELSEGLIE